MINFGIGYQGSKSAIAADLIRVIPSGDRFVDVFAGGCAMTHAALLAGRWPRILANDIVELPEFFVNAVKGKYKNETRWISREDFFRLKDSDLYARYVFSFGNNGQDYIYDARLEPYKKACHYAVVFDDWGELFRLCPEAAATAKAALQGKTDRQARRLAFGPAVVRKLRTMDRRVVDANPLYKSVRRSYSKDFKRRETHNPSSLQNLESLERLERLQSLERLQNLESLERLQSLERLECLQSLERLERLQSLENVTPVRVDARCGDYRGIDVQQGDVLYCDPPYKGTRGYNGKSFDHEAFYAWALAQRVPVYISEYDMPADRFMCIWQKSRASRASAKGTEGTAVEKLFVPRSSAKIKAK